jgi:phytoene dehydrogenase-like protein
MAEVARSAAAGPCDALIIGAGHNGLVCAAYLAAAGLRVVVLERRAVVGGAAVTEEFHPGFRNSVASYTVSLLNPKVIRDLDLPAHGLRVVERRCAIFLPTADGRYLLTGEGRTGSEVARFSPRDAARLPEYSERLEAIADVLRDLVLQTPPNAVEGSWRMALPELLRAARVGGRLRRLDMTLRRELLGLFAMSAGDYLDNWFESDPIKAVYGFDGIVGNYASPYTPGSAYVLLHHVFGEVNGKRGVWGHAIGGMGAITQAMARAAAARGAVIRVESGVREVLVEGDRAVGVVTESGETLRAAAVISNLNPKLLYLKLLPPQALPPEFREHISHWRCGSGTFRMNVALKELPDFTCLPGKAPADHHTAGIIIGPTLAYMERAYFDARSLGWSRQPVIEMLIPSTLDDTLAPPGQHVASLFCQHVAPQLPNGESWDAHRETVADLMIDTVTAHAPNFRAAVLGRQIMSPLDLERTFGLVGGDIFHGALSLDQLFSARPMLGYGNYRGPLRGLYMCGAGTHPGGGVTGAPGHNAAREILTDFRRGGCGGRREPRARAPGSAPVAARTAPRAGRAPAALRAPAPRAATCGADRGHHRVPEALRARGPVDPHHQRPGRGVGRSDQPPLSQQGRADRRGLPALQRRAGRRAQGRGGAGRRESAGALAGVPRGLLLRTQSGRRGTRRVGGVLGPVPPLAADSARAPRDLPGLPRPAAGDAGGALPGGPRDTRHARGAADAARRRCGSAPRGHRPDRADRWTVARVVPGAGHVSPRRGRLALRGVGRQLLRRRGGLGDWNHR